MKIRRKRTRTTPLKAAAVETPPVTSNTRNGDAVMKLLEASSVPSASRDRRDDMRAEGKAMARAAYVSVYDRSNSVIAF